MLTFKRVLFALISALTLRNPFIRPPGGYSVWKRVPTVDRVLRSCGCREQTMLKKGGCPVIIDDYTL